MKVPPAPVLSTLLPETPRTTKRHLFRCTLPLNLSASSAGRTKRTPPQACATAGCAYQKRSMSSCVSMPMSWRPRSCCPGRSQHTGTVLCVLMASSQISSQIQCKYLLSCWPPNSDVGATQRTVPMCSWRHVLCSRLLLTIGAEKVYNSSDIMLNCFYGCTSSRATGFGNS